MANNKKIKEPFERNRWKFIINDEAHTYRNYKTCTSIALLRLILGKKANESIMRTIRHKKKTKFDYEEIKSGRKKFSDHFTNCLTEGSPESFR